MTSSRIPLLFLEKIDMAAFLLGLVKCAHVRVIEVPQHRNLPGSERAET